jgi:hypothetical protein
VAAVCHKAPSLATILIELFFDFGLLRFFKKSPLAAGGTFDATSPFDHRASAAGD